MSTPTAPSPLHAVTEQVESLDALDGPGQALAKAFRQAVGPGTLKDLLSGTWLGHPLHPLLTDVVIGSFASATVLDVVAGDDADPAVRKLLGLGLTTYPLTALAGVNDWADAEPVSDGVRRTGVVHASTNSVAFTLFALSLRARRRGRTGAGRAFALAGAGALVAAGYLGAHLTYIQGVGVNQSRFDAGPEDWTPVAVPEALVEGRTLRAIAGDTPVMLVRRDGHVRAIHDRCSHRGCSLSEGKLVERDIVECACHGSRFSLNDGKVVRGPAVADQPVFEVLETGESIEIRLTPRR
jgi:nitrite reductase/ring-hydroxylating ferredoxin subunit/uncharacterized membrane protein